MYTQSGTIPQHCIQKTPTILSIMLLYIVLLQSQNKRDMFIPVGLQINSPGEVTFI